MKNRLFLICPTSGVEHFIREKYGDSSFFLTALGAVFKLKYPADRQGLFSFIERESIEEIIVVSDTSCCFIQRILTRQKGHGTYAEQVLLDLLLEHHTAVTDGASVAEQQARLAALNVQRQLDELLGIDYFLQKVVLQKLRLKGLVTSSATGKIKAVNFHSNALAVWT